MGWFTMISFYFLCFNSIAINCNKIANSNDLTPKIIRKTINDTYPHMVMLTSYFKNEDSKFFVGTLLNNNYVLTAAHPLYFRKYQIFTKLEAVLDLEKPWIPSNSKEHTFIIYQENVFIHPNFHERGLNDLALIKLDETAETMYNLKPACLPDEQMLPPYNSHLTTTDWGDINDKYGHEIELFQVLDLKLQNPEQCKTTFEGYIKQFKLNREPEWIKAISASLSNSLLLCAGSVQNTNANKYCVGDSGAPLFINSTKGGGSCFTIYGILTGRTGQCIGYNTPGIYANINSHLAWIENIIYN